MSSKPEGPPQDVVLVPAKLIGAIIGRAGSGLKEIRTATGCQINVPRETGDDTRSVELWGLPEGLALARSIIEYKVAEGPTAGQKRPRESNGQMQSLQQYAYLTSDSPKRFATDVSYTRAGAAYQMAMPMIGADGTMLTAFNPYGASLQMPMMGHLSGSPRSLPRMTPDSSGSLPLRLLFPNSLAGMIIGKGGESLKELRSASGTKLDLLKDPVAGYRMLTVNGGGIMNKHMCVGMLLEKISNQRTPQGEEVTAGNELKLLFPTPLAGILIGKGGAGLEVLRKASGAHVNIEKEEILMGERVVTVRGNPEEIKNALWCTTDQRQGILGILENGSRTSQ